MNIKSLRKNKKGFTLIEIIVVVVILAVLMAVAVPSVLKYMGEADEAKYMSQARGAYISSQGEITKEYIADKTAALSADGPFDGTPAVSSVTLYKRAAAATAITATKTGDQITLTGAAKVGAESPEVVEAYIVKFADKVAVVLPNGSVTVAKTITGEPA